MFYISHIGRSDGKSSISDRIHYHELMVSDGIVFLTFFAVFMYYTYLTASSLAKQEKQNAEVNVSIEVETENHNKAMSIIKIIIYIILGSIGLAYGGDLIVDSAIHIAEKFGILDRVIGLVIVGPGTSLPELILSIIAALKGQADVIIGNVLGSNIINVFLTLGIIAIIIPVPLDLHLNYIIITNSVVTLLLVLFGWFSRNRQIGKKLAVFLICVYFVYMALLLEVPEIF